MLLTLLNIILPVFAVSGVGYGFARKFAGAPDMDFINRANVSLFCPALIFSAMLAHPLDLASGWPLIVAGVAIILLPGLLLRFVMPTGMHPRAFVMTGMFRNTGNMGIPLMLLAYGNEQLGAVIVLFVLSNLLHFSVGIRLLAGKSGGLGWLMNPNIWAAILGAVLAPYASQLPNFIGSTVQMMGQVSIPLMLFSLGVRIAQGRITRLALALRINLLYLAAGLLTAALLVWLLPLQPEWIALLILSGALPPAVLNYLLSEQYGLDSEVVASVVLLGNLLAVVTVPLVIAFTLSGWLLGS